MRNIWWWIKWVLGLGRARWRYLVLLSDRGKREITAVFLWQKIMSTRSLLDLDLYLRGTRGPFVVVHTITPGGQAFCPYDTPAPRWNAWRAAGWLFLAVWFGLRLCCDIRLLWMPDMVWTVLFLNCLMSNGHKEDE